MEARAKRSFQPPVLISLPIAQIGRALRTNEIKPTTKIEAGDELIGVSFSLIS
jgi:hypothetical protein